MQNRNFEKDVLQKMEQLKLQPSQQVWSRVEAELPHKKKERKWALVIFLFLALLTGVFVTNYYTNKPKQDADTAKNTMPETVVQKRDNETINIQVEESLVKKNVNEHNPPITEKVKPVVESASRTTVKIKPPGIVTMPEATVLPDAENKKRNSAAALKATVKKPLAVSDNGVPTAAIAVNKPSDESTQIENKKEGLAETIIEKKAGEKPVDSFRTADVQKPVENQANKKQEKKRVTLPKWQFGIYAAAGTSGVTNKLFGNLSLFKSYNNAALQSITPFSRLTPDNPKTGTGFSIGLYAEKNINARWKFLTGLNYVYQSNTIKTGVKVDSAATATFDVNQRAYSSNYYRTGSSVTYKNKFHLIEIPAVFRYKVFSKSALYAEAGPSVVWLANTNSLVYNNASSIYMHDAAMFNKMLLFINAGAGFTFLQNKKHPVTIGGQFKFGAVPAVKPAFGKQHLTSMQLFTRISLKK